jgi:putative Flp pilus-assembly TadE/G-like protein
VGREEETLRRQAIRSENGQTLILVVFALPLLLALIALVSDGSNLFANKRSVQNAADASVLAAVRELNPDLSLCTGPASTSGTCLNRIETTASDYSRRNNGSNPLHGCANAADTNCYQTPFPGPSDYGGLQVRLKRSVPLSFGGVVGFSSTSVTAKAAASLGLPGSASNVSPVAVQLEVARCTLPTSVPRCFGPSYPKTIDFDSGDFGFALLNLNCATDTPVSTCASPSGTGQMRTYMDTGFPGLLPVNKWYIQNNGEKNGLKQGVDDVIGPPATKLLIPVYDCVSLTPPVVVCGPGTGQPAAYHVIGFAAFVITSRDKWTGNGTNGKKDHNFSGYFTDFIASGVGGGGTDFGVHVVTLSE